MLGEGIAAVPLCSRLGNITPVPPPRHLEDLEWRLTYVGSAESEKYDQVLDAVFVGPVAPGQYRFVFQVGKEWKEHLVLNYSIQAW